MVTKLEEWRTTRSNRFMRAKHRYNIFHQHVRRVVLSDKFCFIDLLCEILDGVSVGIVSHHPRKVLSSKSASLTKENWMHDLCGSRRYFRSILTPYACVYLIYFASFAAEFPQTSPDMVLRGEECARETLRMFRKKLLSRVQKCFTPG